MISTKQVATLPVLSPQERLDLVGISQDEMKSLPAGLDFANAVEVCQSPKGQALGPRIKLAAWNTKYCQNIEESSKLLASLSADVIFLSEMGYGLVHSSQQHSTARLAEGLGLGYVYGVEAMYSNPDDSVGYRGNAILSRSNFKRPGLARLSTFQSKRHAGGRVAVLATIDVDGKDVVFASVHFENWCSPVRRAEMMRDLLEAIEDYAPQSPAVVAGDLNTLSFELTPENVKDIDTFRRLAAEDPSRFLNPTPHEPLFAVAKEFGYDWEGANIISKSTARYPGNPLSFRGGDRNLDWFLVRGLKPHNPQVVNATPADIAWALSDHEVICVNVEASKDG